MQSVRVMDIYVLAKFHHVMLFELRDLEKEEEEEEEMNNIAPYIYDARHHAHPYILNTTVISDNYMFLLFEAVCCCLHT